MPCLTRKSFSSAIASRNVRAVSGLSGSPIDAGRYEETRRYTVASSPTYAHPIVLRDRVIVRDAERVTTWALR